MREQWRMLNLDPDQAQAAHAEADAASEPDEVDIEILPGLEDAWQCFIATFNQWRVISGMSGVYYQAIDASALQATMDMLGIEQELRPDLFWQVQICEGEARVWRNKQ